MKVGYREEFYLCQYATIKHCKQNTILNGKHFFFFFSNILYVKEQGHKTLSFCPAHERFWRYDHVPALRIGSHYDTKRRVGNLVDDDTGRNERRGLNETDEKHSVLKNVILIFLFVVFSFN